jgi:hypothetical protein
MKRKCLLALCLGLLLLLGIAPAILSAQSFADSAFEAVWKRTDKPVADGRTARSWLWGLAPFTEAVQEAYQEAPGGTRLVQYFDKSRMEVNDPYGDRSSPWFVTNGLLVREMVDGRVATGNSSYSQSTPSQEAVAGDPAATNPNCPTYATFQYLSWQRAEDRTGQAVTTIISRDSSTWDDPSKAGYAGTTVAYYEGTLGHNVPRVFWDFMNQTGLVYENGAYHTRKVFDWLYAMGYPITEAYWTRAVVGGVEKDVMIQLFERRVLSYTPSNPAGWQVEMGNVGQHYYNWRYGAGGPQPPSQTINEGDVVKVADDGAIYLIQNGHRRLFPDWDTFVGMGYSLPMVKVISREQLESIPLGDPIPSVHACQQGMAKIRFQNHLEVALTLDLSGPEHVHFVLGSGESRNYCLYAGSYSYYATAPSYVPSSGTKTLTAGACQCWHWYYLAPPFGCDCSNNMGDYARP